MLSFPHMDIDLCERMGCNVIMKLKPNLFEESLPVVKENLAQSVDSSIRSLFPFE